MPQWVYPCGITPNGTFPNGQRPFTILNTTTGVYELLSSMDYGYYFRGAFDEWAHSFSTEWRDYLLKTQGYGGNDYQIFPYGWKGNGDMILRHFGNFTPQYPYARFGISNDLTYNGTCPHRIFNSTHFFGGGYIGLEDHGFEQLYPCGIRPDGLFTNAWLGFPNGSVPNNTYPFGYFPNNTFPYVDYFFNPDFNHTALYWAAQRNETSALQNYTSFLNPNTTHLHYHPIPTNYTEPFASCYGIYPPRSHRAMSNHTRGGDRPVYPESYPYHAWTSADFDRNLIQAGLWGAQLGAELALLSIPNSSWSRRRFAYAFYLGTRTANIVHSVVDLISNLAYVLENGPTNGEGERALRNMLTLTDALNLATEAVYFCTPAIERLQERVTDSQAATYFTRMCSSLRGTSQVVRGALNRLTAIIGAVGVAGTATLSAALTTQLIHDDERMAPEHRVILGLQIGVAAVAACALGWITRANHTRASRENT